jgi:hypothetical protein
MCKLRVIMHIHSHYCTPNATLFADLGFFWYLQTTLLPNEKQTREDASRRAENIGTLSPQAESMLCPVVKHQPLLVRVSRWLDGCKAEPEVSPSPCIWRSKQRAEHLTVVICLPWSIHHRHLEGSESFVGKAITRASSLTISR